MSALALLVVAPSTAGATTISVPYDLAAGPVLTGYGVAVASRSRAYESQATVRTFERDGTRRIAQPLGPPQSGEDVVVDLAGSATAFAGALSSYFGSESAPDVPVLSDVWAGRPLGSWTRIMSCEQRGPVRHEVAVSGKLVAQTGTECTGEGPVGRPRITVTTLAPGLAYLTPTLTLEEPATASLSGLRFAGRFLAWRRSTERAAGVAPPPGASSSYVVYDTVARRDAYSITTPASSFFTCDLSATGELACLRSDTSGTGGTGDASCRGRYRLAWYSIDSPTPHELAVAPCVGLLRVSGRRVAVARSAARGRAELVLAGLDGTVTPVTSFPARGAFAASIAPGAEGLDFDGERVAWVSHGCTTLTLHVRALDATRSEPGRALSCPIAVAGRDLLVDRHNRTRVRVACPNGCRGSIYVSRRHLPLASGYRNFALPPGRQAVNIGLALAGSRPPRSLLTRGRRLAVELTVDSYGADGVPKRRQIQISLRAGAG